ncbi:MAG: DUF1178 family protein [Nitratireductor sp.]|nr:DUF1178 family protein [Nitratireductor sp.]
MIRYSLGCDKGHEFEGWFASSADHDSQQARGLISCPVCGSQQVSKLLMAPSVSTSKRKQAIAAGSSEAAEESVGMAIASLSDEQREIVARMRALKQELVSKSENVGERFSEEARKIHYGESPARGIYGKATPNEAAELVEEGIDVLAIPDFPDERN